MPRGRAPGYDDQREAILAHAAAAVRAPRLSRHVDERGGRGLRPVARPTLYHYYSDKYALLVPIAEGHVQRLRGAGGRGGGASGWRPRPQLRELIERFVEEYADAQHAHRVLTEDVRFLDEADRERVLDKERAVVAGFARAVARAAPGPEARASSPSR